MLLQQASQWRHRVLGLGLTRAKVPGADSLDSCQMCTVDKFKSSIQAWRGAKGLVLTLPLSPRNHITIVFLDCDYLVWTVRTDGDGGGESNIPTSLHRCCHHRLFPEDRPGTRNSGRLRSLWICRTGLSCRTLSVEGPRPHDKALGVRWRGMASHHKTLSSPSYVTDTQGREPNIAEL